MAKPYPEEFRRDVVSVARKHEAPLAQIAKDFGISEGTLNNWLKRADVEDGVRPGVTQADAVELRELRKRNRLLEQENEILRRAAAFFARELPPKMKYPLVRDLAADGIPVTVACRVLGFSPQGFNKWRRTPVSQRDWDDAHLTDLARDIHHDDPTFGYRFVADEIADQGVRASERRIWRICSQQRLWSLHAKKRGLTRKAGPPVHDDLVLRRFHADRPNQLWLTDITEHRTDAGKLYLCAIKDVHSKRIVGYSMDDRMTSALAVSAVRNAIRMRGPVDTILHSDRGSRFRSKVFVQTLKSSGLTGSMGRVGACGDNAAMESFFALLQKNVLDRQRWATKEDLRLAIVTWIERTYHRTRRQRALGRMTPVEFEILGKAATTAARNQQHPTGN